jgi:hypothetical protein
MQLDIRYPMGFLFGSLGLIIAVYGALTKHLSLGININLWWGIVLLVFGVIMLALARAASAKQQDSQK